MDRKDDIRKMFAVLQALRIVDEQDIINPNPVFAAMEIAKKSDAESRIRTHRDYSTGLFSQWPNESGRDTSTENPEQ